MEEIKNDFINNVSHEFKTPISSISVCSEVLMNDDFSKDSERLKQYAQIIQHENNKLKNLIESALISSIYSSGNVGLNRKEINVHDLLHSIIENFKLQVEQRGGKISQFFNALKDEIYADEIHITNIFVKIMDNALKYSKQNPEIIVSTVNKNEYIIVSIQDHGVGIDKKNMKHIFKQFYRVSSGDKHDVKGYGLGLSYVKQFVELHGGHVYLTSQLNKGTTFFIELPYKH